MGEKVVTDYGLHYNTDGSLCVTVRDDEIPFEGVKSFAIEEGTTNMLGLAAQNWSLWTHYISSTYWDQTTVREYEDEKMGKVFEGKAASSQTYIFNYSKYSYESNKDYTISVFIYSDKEFSKNISGYLHDGSGSFASKTILVDLKKRWQKISFTLKSTKVVSGRGGFGISISGSDIIGCLFAFAYPQLEEKPFSTSFTEETRINGKLKIPVNFQNNFAINLWIKPLYKHSSEKEYLVNGISGEASGFILGYDNGLDNKWFLWLHQKETSEKFYYKFDKNMHDGMFHMVTLIKNNSIWKVYIDGLLNITADKEITNINPYLLLGWYNSLSYSNPSCLYSSLTIGDFFNSDFDNGNGSVNENYIKMIYESKKSFITGGVI